MSKVRVFSTTTCPYCTMAKNWLAEKGIAFEDIDVSHDRNAAMEMIQISGQRGVPVIDIDGTVIVGFDKPRMSRALGV